MQTWNHDEYQCECKELHDWSSCINDYIWNPNTCDCECNQVCKIGEYLYAENRSCKKHFFDNLVLTCQDEISNTTETSLRHNIVIHENNCLIYTISVVIYACYY